MNRSLGRWIQTPLGILYLPAWERILSGAVAGIAIVLVVIGICNHRLRFRSSRKDHVTGSLIRNNAPRDQKMGIEPLSRIFGLHTGGSAPISLESTIMGKRPVALVRIGTEAVHVGLGDSLPHANAVVESIGRGLIVLRMEDEIIRIHM